MQATLRVNKTPIFLIIGAFFRAIMEGARLVMVDLGISGFVDKIETHFGRLVARVVLLLIVLTLVAVCLSTIYSIAVEPLIASVQDIFEAQTFSFSSYFDLIKNATILVLVVALSLSLVKNYRWKKLEQENQKALGEIAAVLNEAFNNEDSKKLMESIDAKLADKGSP